MVLIWSRSAVGEKAVREIAKFHQLVGQLSYPMLIVTAAGGDDRGGCLVGFHTQCSIDPPRFLVCLSQQNHTFRVAARSDKMGVHFLDASNYDLSVLFGEQTGDQVDKFAECPWQSRRGVPILTGVRGWFIGRILNRTVLGDHTGYLLEPEETGLDGALHQLSFPHVKDMQPGHP
jgi:flavin reductase (DIM6/NTAB) family NADH-FMN oxidoreductase RutF